MAACDCCEMAPIMKCLGNQTFTSLICDATLHVGVVCLVSHVGRKRLSIILQISEVDVQLPKRFIIGAVTLFTGYCMIRERFCATSEELAVFNIVGATHSMNLFLATRTSGPETVLRYINP